MQGILLMNLKIGILLIWGLAVFAGLPGMSLAQEDSRQGIVIWQLEAKRGVDERDIDSISGFITAEAEKQSGLKAVSEADIRTILQGEERKQQCGADGTSCIAEIGSALGVPEAISGDLGRMGDYWMLNLRRINVRNASVIARVGKQIRGDVNTLVEAIPGAVAELFGKEPPKAVVAEPEPAVETEPVSEAPLEIKSENKPGMSVLNKAAFGTFFSGVGLVVLGGIGHWQMGVARDDEAAGDSSASDRHATWKGVSATGYAVGGALMATGVALWIVDATRDKDKDESMALQFGVSPTEQGFSACILGRW